MAQSLTFNDSDVDLTINTSTGTNDLRVTGVEGQRVVAALRQLKIRIPTLRKIVWDNPGGAYIGRMSVWADGIPRILRLSFSNLTLPSPNFIYTFINGSWTEAEIGHLDHMKDALLTFNSTHVLTTVSGFNSGILSGTTAWNNILHYFPMEETDGIRYDSYGTGTMTGAGVGFSSGKRNNCASLSGGPLLFFGAMPAGNKSVSLWVNFPSVAGTQTFFYTQSPGTQIERIGTILRLTGSGGGSVVSGTAVIAIDTWYHIVYTLNDAGNTSQVYVNGVLDITAANTETDPNLSLDGTSSVLKADETAIFSVVIPTSQVSALYNSGAGRFL